MKTVKDYNFRSGISISNLIREMNASGGFTSKYLAEGIKILKKNRCSKTSNQSRS